MRDKEKKKLAASIYYLKNKDRILKQCRQYYLRTKDKQLKESKDRYYDENNYTKYILWRCKKRAREKGLKFNIDVSDIIIPKFCPLLNIELKRCIGSKNKWSENSPSLDRINPRLGYVKDNVRIISQKANVMKNSATREELITFAKSILKENELS